MNENPRPRNMNKYHAVRVVVDGISFASKKEALRYQELKLMEKAKVITNLQLQPRFSLLVAYSRVGIYVGDFSYIDRGGILVVEDVKGFKTPVYRLKKKLMKAIYGIEIREI